MLSKKQLDSMANLYLTYYDGSNKSLVLSDLMKKTHALLLYFKKTLVGFTTFEVYGREWRNNPITIIYSGDTIVQKDHWGQQALAYARQDAQSL